MAAGFNHTIGGGKSPGSRTLDVSATPPMVHLDWDDFSLLLPTSDLASLAAPRELGAASEQIPQSCGSLEFEGIDFPVFCLNKSLQIQPALSGQDRSIVLLKTQGYCFGISCCALGKLDVPLGTLYAVPPSMTSRKQPFTQFALINQRAMGLSSAAALLALLKLRGVRIQPQQDSLMATRKGAG